MHNLEDIITTCSYCKEVMDINGEWQHLAKYLSKITDIKFQSWGLRCMNGEAFP